MQLWRLDDDDYLESLRTIHAGEQHLRDASKPRLSWQSLVTIDASESYSA